MPALSARSISAAVLPTPEKTTRPSGLGRGGQHALQLAAGDDVEARAMLGQQLENRQRGVGLDRVADQVIAARERLLKQPQPLDDLVGGVDVERRTEAAGQRLQRDACRNAGLRRAAGDETGARMQVLSVPRSMSRSKRIL